jgi:hypothetical protein
VRQTTSIARDVGDTLFAAVNRHYFNFDDETLRSDRAVIALI